MVEGRNIGIGVIKGGHWYWSGFMVECIEDLV
jgi:hypothetical protein